MQLPDDRCGSLKYERENTTPSSRYLCGETIFLAVYISSPILGDATDHPCPAAAMDRVRFIEHKGRRIVLLDFAGITDPTQGLAAVAEATKFIGALPVGGDTMTLTDVTDTRYDRKVVEAFKAMTASNRPIVKSAAIVSNSSLHRAAISMIALFSRRKLEVFDSRPQALEWLVSQR